MASQLQIDLSMFLLCKFAHPEFGLLFSKPGRNARPYSINYDPTGLMIPGENATIVFRSLETATAS